MASSPYARLGSARRKLITNQTRASAWQNFINTAGTLALYAGKGLGESADAWKDYKTGYEDVTGMGAPKQPSWWKRLGASIIPGGSTGMPEGDVEGALGETYKRENLVKYGKHLDTELGSRIGKERLRRHFLDPKAPVRPNVPISGDEDDYSDVFRDPVIEETQFDTFGKWDAPSPPPTWEEIEGWNAYPDEYNEPVEPIEWRPPRPNVPMQGYDSDIDRKRADMKERLEIAKDLPIEEPQFDDYAPWGEPPWKAFDEAEMRRKRERIEDASRRPKERYDERRPW